MISEGNRVTINSDGEMNYAPSGEIKVKCKLDLRLFPFDTQECSVKVESWSYDTSEQVFIDAGFHRVDRFWTENKQWEIISNRTQQEDEQFFDSSRYSQLTFVLILKRRSLFYYVHVIVPGIIISVVELVTFVLPITDVVKIHISFTCLLAYSVFQAMIIGDMPKSSDSVPLLSLYIDLQMGYIAVIAILFEGIVFIVIGQNESLGVGFSIRLNSCLFLMP